MNKILKTLGIEPIRSYANAEILKKKFLVIIITYLGYIDG